MNQKKLITILATIAIIAIMGVSLFFTQLSVATATTYNPDNLTVNGVLATDSYVLYPYAKENLIFGVSKYGELINSAAKVGLKYDGMDVFANPNVLEQDWSQGWFIDIHYAAKDNSYQNVWAFAMYSDLSGTTGIGGDWKEGCTLGPLGAPHGGRKTNAWASTDDIKILYDGPRRFVALTNTTIYEDSLKTKALVGVTITVVFNKVKKHVVLYKDIKRLDRGKWGRTFQVEFSNRGEWDIGTAASPPSYAHFYDNLTTVYDYEYHDFYNATYDVTGFDAAQIIDEDGDYVGWAAFWPQTFGKLVDGTNHITQDIVLGSLCTKMYNLTWDVLGSPSGRNITWGDLGWPSADPYPRGDGLWSDEPMVFKNGILHSGAGADYTWDGSADKIVFNIEPLDTDYITVVYKHETNAAEDDDMSAHTTEPQTPYVIGEWCFDLEDMDRKRQFRAVTLYGLTDRHDADDDDADAETWQTVDANVIDSEVQYYLNETFNPYDLYDAVHKDTRRWVQFHTVTTAEVLAETLEFDLDHVRVVYAPDWTEYCVFAERVQWNDALRIPQRAVDELGLLPTAYDYVFKYNSTSGVGSINITDNTVTRVPAAGTIIKVLYSTKEKIEKVDLITIEDEQLSYRLTHWPVAPNTTKYGAEGVMVVNVTATGAPAILDPAGYNMDTHANGTLKFTNASGYEVWPGDEFKVIYEVWSGSYEWMVVGKDAATIDCLGAAYMTEAFDSLKDISVKVAGLDINETAYGPYSPFVMAGATTGTKADYRDSLGRPHLRDDWCTEYPVSSSNMLFSGGPIPNLGTEYFNEFTNAFWTRPEYVVNDTGHAYTIFGLSCWNRNNYSSIAKTATTAGYGYAVVSVYKDINGTIGFLIWGHHGQDTYYATKWFWDEGIVYLQTENRGVTDIILEIYYPCLDPTHPSVSIVERIGTISEKTPHDP